MHKEMKQVHPLNALTTVSGTQTYELASELSEGLSDIAMAPEIKQSKKACDHSELNTR